MKLACCLVATATCLSSLAQDGIENNTVDLIPGLPSGVSLKIVGPSAFHPDRSKGQALEQDGDVGAAIHAYLGVPGQESAASTLARKHPRIAAEALEEYTENRSPAGMRSWLVRGDLHLSRGEREKALVCYRDFRKAISSPKENKAWEDLAIPHDYCPIYRSAKIDEGRQLFSQIRQSWCATNTRLDHWLINRFVALEAWPDAAQEFSRIQGLHDIPQGSPSSAALQFTLNHAIFMMTRDRNNAALELLTRYLLRIVVDDPRTQYAPGRMTFYNAPAITGDEFIRLTYGAFKIGGREADLVETLESSRDLSVLRVLARVRMHQGRATESVRLEINYLDRTSLPDGVRHYRKGCVYMTTNLHAKAVTEFEAAKGTLIKKDSESAPHLGSPELQLLNHLETSYLALGRMEEVLMTRLEGWELMPALVVDIGKVEEARQMAENMGAPELFLAWSRQALTDEKYALTARANLAWCNEEYATAIDLLQRNESADNGGSFWRLGDWMSRFHQHGDSDLTRKFLESLIVASPHKTEYHFELIRLLGYDAPDAAMIAFYENMLENDRSHAYSAQSARFAQSIKTSHPAVFRSHDGNFGEAAQRLMRLYSRNGRGDDLRALGFRMARREQPFERIDRYSHACETAMSCFITLLDREDLMELRPLLDANNWQESQVHLEWILRGGVQGDLDRFRDRRKEGVHIENPVRAVVSDSAVMDLTCDEQWVYVGFPWGVGIYDHEGNLTKRIPLGAAASCLAAGGGVLWVGSPIGLFQVDLATGSRRFMRCDQEVPASRKKVTDYSWNFRNGIRGLALQGDTLWIGSRQNIRRLDVKTLELRVYSQRDLQVESHRDWTQFHFENDGSVWAFGREPDVRHYDPAEDRWSVLDVDEPMKVRSIIGRYGDELWASVFVGTPLEHRPAIVDPESLRVEPVRITSKATKRQREYRRDLHVVGTWNGDLVFRSDPFLFVYNRKINRLEPLPKDWDASQLEGALPSVDSAGSGTVFIRQDGVVSMEYRLTLSRPGGTWRGSRVSAGRDYHDRTVLDRLNEMPPSELTHDDARGVTRILSEELSGTAIFDALPTRWGVWLCTNRGISLLAEDGRVIANYDRRHGLPCNASTSAAEVDGKIYFACSVGDDGGGLVVFDPLTSCFTSLRTTDGLASNFVDQVEGIDGKVAINFVRHRNNSEVVRQHGRVWYDPRTGTFTKRSAERTFKHPYVREKWDPMPLLGGDLIKQRNVGECTWVLGSRGVLILETGQRLGEIQSPREELVVHFVKSKRLQQIEDAREIRKNGGVSGDEAISHPNPFVTADYLADYRTKLTAQQLAKVADMLDSPMVDVRRAVVKALARHPSPETGNALKVALSDRDVEVRKNAAPVVAEFAEDLPHERLTSMLQVDDNELHRRLTSALSKRGDALDKQIVELLLRYPPSISHYSVLRKSDEHNYSEMGKTITSRPDLAEVLLKADDTRVRYGTSRNLMYAVFMFAGKELLPVVHESLRSEDRVIRANAALACAGIADASSLEPLLGALDLESGLSKGAIVWALGELGDQNAVPELLRLYDDENLVISGRYQPGTALSNVGDHFDSSLKNNDLVAVNMDGEADEFLEWKQQKERRNQMGREPLLTRTMIAEALFKIGPQHAQELFRAIASDKRQSLQTLAIAALGRGTGKDRGKNIPILHILAAEKEDEHLAYNAAIGLYLLGEHTVSDAVFSEAIANGNKSSLTSAAWRVIKNSSETDKFERYVERMASGTPAEANP